MRKWRSIIIASTLSGITTGCYSVTQTTHHLPRPSVLSEVSYFHGTSLSGPVDTKKQAPSRDQMLRVKVTMMAVERLNYEVMEPLATKMQLITSAESEKTFAPTTRLARGARVGAMEAAQEFIADVAAGRMGATNQIDELYGVLPQRGTVIFRTVGVAPQADPAMVEPTAINAAIEISRLSARPDGRDRIQVTLAIEDTVEATGEQRAERIVLQSVSLDQDYRLALLFESPFRSSRAAGVTAFIEISTPTFTGDEQESEFEEAYSKYIAGNDQPGDAGDIQERESDAGSLNRGFADAMEGLRSGETRRAAVTYLAHSARALLAESLGHSAEVVLIDQIADRVSTQVIDTEQTDLAAIGWVLEHAAFWVLLEGLGHPPESAELEGILTDRAGELGRHLGSLEWTIRAASSLDDLEERLIRENIVFLLDTSPAARVRAYDWLDARGSAPPSYDPLDSIRERRTAVINFITARRAAAEGVSP